MMIHDDAFDLLAPLALDALDVEARNEVEEHVATCPRCQAELDGLREVATAMGTTYEPLPEALWGKISSRLYEREGAEASMVPALQFDEMKLSGALARRPGISRRAKIALGTVLLVAAAVILILALNLASATNQVTNLQQAQGQSEIARALATPGHEVATLMDSRHQDLAEFVMLPDGRGYLISSTLPSLSSRYTYQLWGIVKGSPVSIGVMGRSPSDVTFTLVSSPSPTALAVTVEPAGGSLTPAKKLVASGAV
jgi:anti-sigma-K factor RskA